MNNEREIFLAIDQIYSDPENKDKYGQIRISSLNEYNLKKRMSDMAFKFLENGCSKFGILETYGNKYQIYKALRPTKEFFKQKNNENNN